MRVTCCLLRAENARIPRVLGNMRDTCVERAAAPQSILVNRLSHQTIIKRQWKLRNLSYLWNNCTLSGRKTEHGITTRITNCKIGCGDST